MPLWSLGRPAQISIAGRWLKADDEFIALGLSVATGGPPEYERRIAKVWSAFYAQGSRLICKCPSLWTRWERWLRHASPALSFGSLSWFWNDTTTSGVDATVNRMACKATDLRELEEGWLSWNIRALRDARSWVHSKLGCTCSEWLLGQCVKKWESWFARHELAHIRRMLGWQSAAHSR